MKVTLLSDACGAEITGIGLSRPLDVFDFAKIHKALFVNLAYTDHIVGMDPAEGRELLDALNARRTRTEFVYRCKWRLHDLAFWADRRLTHIADPPEPCHDRHMHRTTVEGDRPV
jgi:alpha-ketoglutarate-dependent taurine dioxygenase